MERRDFKAERDRDYKREGRREGRELRRYDDYDEYRRDDRRDYKKDYERRDYDRSYRNGRREEERYDKYGRLIRSDKNKRDRSRSPPVRRQENKEREKEAVKPKDLVPKEHENETKKEIIKEDKDGKIEVEVDNLISESLENEEEQMARLMGFSGFSTTKDTKKEDVYAADVVKQRKYRQYMNRKGGYNRPLEKM